MTFQTPGGFRMTERIWQAGVLALSAAIIVLTLWCLSNGITIVFMHLYYIPIVLLAYHYRKRGIVPAILLSLSYFTLVFFYAGSPADIEAALIRVFVFIAIALLVAYLSEELVSARDALSEITKVQQGIIQNANVWLMVLENDGRIREWNRAAEELSGYAAFEVVGKNTIWKRLYPEPGYRKEVTEKIREIIAKENYLENLRTTITGKDGRQKTLLWNTKELPGGAGEPPRYIAVGVDITEREQKADEIQLSNIILTTQQETSPDGILIVGETGNILSFNKRFVEIWGIPREIIESRVDERVLTSVLDKLANPEEFLARVNYLYAHRGEKSHEEIRLKDGTFIERYSSPMLGQDGRYFGRVWYFHDITERKNAETTLQESEEKYRAFFSTSQDCVFITTLDGRWVDFNDAAVNLFGYQSREDLVRIAITDMYAHPEDRAAHTRYIQKNGFSFEYPVDLKRKDGSLIHTLITTAVRKNAAGEVIGFQGSIRDITVQKANEDRIRELLRVQETQLRVINTSPAVAFLWRAEENWPVETVSENISQFGYTQEDFLSGRIQYSAIVHSDDIERVGAEVEYNGKNHIDDFRQEYRILTKEKTILWVSDYTHIRRDTSGTITHYEGVVLDITERKRAETALQDAQFLLSEALEMATMGHWEFDVPTGTFTFNDRFYALYATTAEREGGYQMRADKYAHNFVYPDDMALVGKEIEKALASTDPAYLSQVEHRIVRRDGAVRHIIVRIRITKDAAGRTIKTHGANQDITELKQAEEQLLESRQLFSDIISFLPDPTFVIDSGGKVLAWNRAIELLSGVPSDTIIGKGNYEYSLWQYGIRRPVLIDLVQNPDTDAARMNYLNIHRDGSTITAEKRVKLPSGKEGDFSFVASPLFDSQGRIIGAIESLRDVTHVKETEAALARLNASLETMVRDRTQALQDEIAQRIRAEKDVQAALDYTRSVIEANPDLMVVLDTEGKILDINSAGETLTGIPTSQLVGQTYFGHLEDDGTLRSAFARLLADGYIENYVRIRRTDGHLTPLSVHATVVKGLGTIPDRIIVSAHDITRQKEDEAAIKASLKEKELLLREIHHRVNNNLQIIISLIKLQIRTLEDRQMKLVLAETQNRVQAMSLIHEKLYRSTTLSSIEFSDYIRFLASQLYSVYGVDRSRVELRTDIEKIPLDIDTAIPLGLVMNELISNALKHAFPGNRAGTISISGHQDGDWITLIVEDDGASLPPDFPWKETDSLGFRLINSLVDQLGGTIEKGKSQGTMFIIKLHRNGNTGSAV